MPIALCILGALACGQGTLSGPDIPPGPDWDFDIGDPVYQTGASWSAQGLIAFYDNGWSSATHDSLKGLWVFDPRAAERRHISPDAADPTWAPDGKRLAASFSNRVYVMNFDGTNSTIVVIGRGVHIGSPSWSPNGQWVAFSAGQPEQPDPTPYHIRVVRPDGTEEKTLSGRIPGEAFGPSWSPDGQWLAFIHVPPADSVLCPWPGQSKPCGRIATMDDQGNYLRQIPHGEGIPSSLDVSPDGTRIAYTLIRSGGSQIWIVDTAGTNARQLTTDGGQDPTWSPDGMQIVYTGHTPGDAYGLLWIIDVETGRQTPLLSR